MTLPRQVLPGRFYMITRRCTQRQFLLRPDEDTNNAFGYCLAEAAMRTKMEVILPQTMSNHYHSIVFDRFGTIVEFTEHFHKMLAKTLNAQRGRFENLWASEQVSDVELIDSEDVVEKLVYTATNPVTANLVERVSHWPGFSGLRALVRNRTLTFRRPRHFFSKDGCMPESVTLELTVPAELGDRDVIVGLLEERIAVVEQKQARLRAATGRRIVGRGRILRESWRDSPTSHEPRRGLRPRVAARNKWKRVEALQRNAEFVRAYRVARAAMLAGEPIPFPIGTYWLRRFAGVAIATA